GGGGSCLGPNRSCGPFGDCSFCVSCSEVRPCPSPWFGDDQRVRGGNGCRRFCEFGSDCGIYRCTCAFEGASAAGRSHDLGDDRNSKSSGSRPESIVGIDSGGSPDRGGSLAADLSSCQLCRPPGDSDGSSGMGAVGRVILARYWRAVRSGKGIWTHIDQRHTHFLAGFPDDTGG